MDGEAFEALLEKLGCPQTALGRFVISRTGPATKNLNGYIRRLEVRLAGIRPAEVIGALWIAYRKRARIQIFGCTR